MICKICGEKSGFYPLCRKCNNLKEDGKITKCESCGSWKKDSKPLCHDCWVEVTSSNDKPETNYTDQNFRESNDSSLNNNEKNHKKGVSFEQYVIDLFDPSYFNVYDYTRDNSKHLNRKVESDKNPDITMRCKQTDELFSIECKFRSNAPDDKVSWARSDQIINYLSYAQKNKRPVFVVIGLGGSPDNPNRMFCLPIEEAKYPDLYISMLEKFERTPSQMFFWERETLR